MKSKRTDIAQMFKADTNRVLSLSTIRCYVNRLASMIVNACSQPNTLFQRHHALFWFETCVRLNSQWLLLRPDAVLRSDADVSIFGPALIAPAGAVHVPIRVAVTSFAGILFNFRWA